MSPNRISVLVPVFRAAPFIEEALQSIFMQISSEVEVLIFDDASDDETLAAINRAVDNHGQGRILVVRRSTQLGPLNYFDILDHATGDILIWAHGDDVSLPGRFAKLQACFEDPDIMLVSSNAVITDRLGNSIKLYATDEADETITDPQYHADCAYRHNALGATYAARRRLFEDLAFDRQDIVLEDIVLPFRAALLGKHRFLAEPLIEWRHHGGNLHMAIASECANDEEYEVFQPLVLMSLVARRKDLDRFMSTRGSTPALQEIGARLDKQVAERCNQWLHHRIRMLWDGWRPTWQGPTPPLRASGLRRCVIPVDQPFATRRGADGEWLLDPAKGWNEAETWGTWGKSTAMLSFQVGRDVENAEQGLVLLLRIRGVTGSAQQQGVVSCGGQVLWSGLLPWQATLLHVTIPKHLIAGGSVDVLLKSTPGIRLCELPELGSPDDRVLGFGIMDVELRRSGSPSQVPIGASIVPGEENDRDRTLSASSGQGRED